MFFSVFDSFELKLQCRNEALSQYKWKVIPLFALALSLINKTIKGFLFPNWQDYFVEAVEA